jgi:hypothetical protein
MKGWRKLHNEEVHRLHVSPNIVRVIKYMRDRHVARMGQMRNAYKILVGRWEGVDRMHLAQERDQWRALVNTVMILRVQ